MNSSSTNRPSLLEGSIAKLSLTLAMPVLIAMSFQTLYALVNLFFVGRLGAKAVAGVSVSLTAFFVVLTLAQSLGVGGLALISQAWGKKEFNQGREIFTQILWVALFIGFISWILGFFGAAKYISFFTQDPETFTQGFAYFRLYSMTFFLQLFMMSTSFCFRGSGDFMTPMRMMLLSVFMNILLDPILIYGLLGVPALGVRGAALASIISQSTTCLVYGYWIVSRRLNLYVTSKWQPDWQEIKKILRIGLPSGLQYSILAVIIAITYRWLRPLGPEVTAAVGIGFRLLHASYLPMISFAIATSTLIGQNFGAKLLPRMRSAFRWGMLYSCGWSIFITTLLMIFPGWFLEIFTKDAVVIAQGTLYLRVFGLSNFLVAPIFVATSTFQGLGKTITPLIGALLKLLVCLTFWLCAYDSRNLYWIYGASLLGIFLELLWDLIMARRVLKSILTEVAA